MDSNAEEQAHYEELRELKRRNLRTIERQIEQQGGDANAAPHLLVQRAELRAYLGIVEPIVVSPIPNTIGEDLGPNGRFIAQLEEQRQTKKTLADLVSGVDSLERRFEVFIAETVMWRKQKDEEDADHRKSLGRVYLLLAIGAGVLVVVVVIGTALITWLAARGA